MPHLLTHSPADDIGEIGNAGLGFDARGALLDAVNGTVAQALVTSAHHYPTTAKSLSQSPALVTTGRQEW